MAVGAVTKSELAPVVVFEGGVLLVAIAGRLDREWCIGVTDRGRPDSHVSCGLPERSNTAELLLAAGDRNKHQLDDIVLVVALSNLEFSGWLGLEDTLLVLRLELGPPHLGDRGIAEYEDVILDRHRVGTVGYKPQLVLL